MQFTNQSIRSMSRKISTLKAFYSWLIDEEKIERNPMKRIKTPKEPKSLPKAMSEQEFEILRYTKKSLRNRSIFELLSSSGMRIGEMVILNINDIDINNRKIIVMGKGGKERIVYFSHIAKYCLIEYLHSRKDNNPALYINKYGNRLSIRSIEIQTKSEAIKAGINIKVTPHRYRHYMASRLYENGCHLELIGELLGHSSIDSTRIYAKMSNSAIAKAYDRYSN
jgi:integrase/recombinase XerD